MSREQYGDLLFREAQNLSKEKWIEFRSTLELQTELLEQEKYKTVRVNPGKRCFLPHSHYIVYVQDDVTAPVHYYFGSRMSREYPEIAYVKRSALLNKAN